MGRPLNKKYFGNPAVESGKVSITEAFVDGDTGAKSGFYIVKQTGTGRYKVTNGVLSGVVKLVNHTPSAAGEATVVVELMNGDLEHARMINNRTVKTFEGGNYKWSFGPASFDTVVMPSTSALVLEEMAEATNGAEALVVIMANKSVFFTTEDQTKFDTFPNGGGRQNAVGDGVYEWIEYFGMPSDVETLRNWTSLHTEVEFNKQTFILAVDNSANVGALQVAFETKLASVVSDRLAMIDDLNNSDVVTAMTRADELEAEDFTVLPNQVQVKIDAQEDLSQFYADVLSGRGSLPGGKFFGTTKMLPVISTAIGNLV